ncbi:MAG: NAD(P)/FAD-dependent oxidoreductase [Clostridiales bacterium]|nr:NAD(P)/FAD-dependent oxidoreductase [Clostridiales bacterium]
MKQIAIAGAGASGLLCAINLKQERPDWSVTVLERMSRPGKKLLATGNGRCNLTNLNCAPQRYRGGDFAAPALAQFPPEETIRYLEALGLYTRADSEGRVYPRSNQAASVLEVLLRACRRLHIPIIADTAVERIDITPAGFTLETGGQTYPCDTLVLACGGRAAPKLGSDGSGYALLERMGHRIVPQSPALVQLICNAKYPKQLNGLRVRCRVSLEAGAGCLGQEEGEVLFTDYGLSGICIMELSRSIPKVQPARMEAVLDLLPELPEAELARKLERLMKQYPDDESILSGLLAPRLGKLLYRRSDGSAAALASLVKGWRLGVTGTLGFDYAQVTSGGADTAQFDPNTMESRLVKHLYACGELLDVDGACGGYNLQWAWSSALCAAAAIIKEDET